MTNATVNGLTPSEKFVSELCKQSFLKLWTHPNPKGKKGKELCDCLVVCDSHIIIISVKDIEYKATDSKTGWERWEKAAIEESATQIWGAERWLNSVDEFTRHDGRVCKLPPKINRHYHRISVSLGSKGLVPIKWGDLGHGFVHVCDEKSVVVIFRVLDTITDFVEFLVASEALVTNGTQLLFDGGGIEDLLALYISHNKSFNIAPNSDESPDLLIVCNDIWEELSKSENFKDIQNDLKESYIWDRLIEHYADDLLTDGMFDMHNQQVTDNELALVTMAMQPRGYRANLAESFMEFLKSPSNKIAARVILGFNQTAFVFLAGSSSDRGRRSRELALRCLVVRGRLPNITTVVGIATDRPGTSKIGYSSDIVYLHMLEWTSKDEADVTGIQNELGYFENTQWSKR